MQGHGSCRAQGLAVAQDELSQRGQARQLGHGREGRLDEGIVGVVQQHQALQTRDALVQAESAADQLPCRQRDARHAAVDQRAGRAAGEAQLFPAPCAE
jgi:hypothetical protein